jgi:hypothetical protein
MRTMDLYEANRELYIPFLILDLLDSQTRKASAAPTRAPDTAPNAAGCIPKLLYTILLEDRVLKTPIVQH